MRERIFVSYSHEDAAWRNRLRDAVSGGIYSEAFDVWSDERLVPGDQWADEIETAIENARIALLLVSQNFLRSDFIITGELPSILRRHSLNRSGQSEGLTVWWIPIDETSNEERQLAGLDQFQAATALDEPLSLLPEEKRADAVRRLAQDLLREFGGLLPDVGPAARDQFKRDVERALDSANTRLGEAFAPGDYSIIYRAKRADGGEVAIKALYPTPRREWLAQDFVDRARAVRNVTNATAIGIRDVIDREVKCVVMEFVEAPTLKALLKVQGECLSYRVVAEILAQIAAVAVDLHGLNGHPIIGPIRPSHVYYDSTTRKARISLIHTANETLRSCAQRPLMLLDPESLTYFTPERYCGGRIDAQADQYHLALLGLELLEGKPPVVVSTFADLEKKTHFFNNPRNYFADLTRRHAAFSFILTRMLEKDPQRRWSSMSEAANALRQLANGEIPWAVKKYANDDYLNRLRESREFFKSFYDRLFESSAEIRDIFVNQRVTMPEQYEKLEKAVGLMFSFSPSVRPTVLDVPFSTHRRLDLKPEHFDLFGAAFLESLDETAPADAYTRDAWHAILDPALAFMRDQVCASGAVSRG
jgi:serine/threonine protein kinase